MRSEFGLAAIAAILTLASCSKSASNGQDAAESTSATTVRRSTEPVAVITSSGVEMVYLPGGEFSMGSEKGSPDEGPVHKVRVTTFLMDKFEVTHELFAKVQLPDPSHWQDNPKTPVERVRWRDAKQYCNERSLQEHLKPCYNEKTADWDCDFSASGYRLPTEAEWEYACRSGAEGSYEIGLADKLRQFAWYGENADQRTHPVGQKKPNRWGLFDLHGNVSEWCEDVFDPVYYRQSPAVDPTGPPNPGKDVRRVVRGGSWKSSAESCRATFRQGEKTGNTDACFFTDYCGFRCVRRITPEELESLLAAARSQR